MLNIILHNSISFNNKVQTHNGSKRGKKINRKFNYRCVALFLSFLRNFDPLIADIITIAN